jgi:hypothetical protein
MTKCSYFDFTYSLTIDTFYGYNIAFMPTREMNRKHSLPVAVKFFDSAGASAVSIIT